MVGLHWTAASLTSPESAPVITSWSNSRTDDQERMLLVAPGEGISFSVKAEGAEQYRWRVNKEAQDQKGPALAWTVPALKEIWEIHVEARNKFGQAHHEWVVSTLSKEEAPDFLDYFADKKYRERDELDPWGRPLPEWTAFRAFGIADLSKCCLQPTDKSVLDDERNTNMELYYPYKHPYGTWRLRYCVPEGPHCTQGGWTHFRYNFLHYPGCGLYRRMFYLREAGQDHAYFGPGAHAWDHDMGVGYERNSQIWYQVTIIQTPDNEFYCYRDGVQEMCGHDMRGGGCTGISIRLHTYTPEVTPQSKIYVDCLEIYRDRFLLPDAVEDEKRSRAESGGD